RACWRAWVICLVIGLGGALGGSHAQLSRWGDGPPRGDPPPGYPPPGGYPPHGGYPPPGGYPPRGAPLLPCTPRTPLSPTPPRRQGLPLRFHPFPPRGPLPEAHVGARRHRRHDRQLQIRPAAVGDSLSRGGLCAPDAAAGRADGPVGQHADPVPEPEPDVLAG